MKVRGLIVWSNSIRRANGLQRVLRPLLGNQFRVTHANSDNALAKEVEDARDGLPPRIVAWPSPAQGPDWLIPRVIWLRSSLRWEGGLIVITTPALAPQIESAALFDPEGPRVRDVDAHVIIPEPFRMSAVLRGIGAADDLYLEVWTELRDSSRVGTVIRMLDRLMETPSYTETEQWLSDCVAETLALLDQLTNLIPHDERRFVREQLAELPNVTARSERFLEIITGARAAIAAWSFWSHP
mgnify:CR=1 FL=1